MEIFRGVLVTLALLANVGGVVWLQSQTLGQAQEEGQLRRWQAEDQREGALLRSMAFSPQFGFGNLVANWVYLQFIQYYGDSPARNKTGYGRAPLYYQALVDTDPRFVKAYLYMEPASSYWAGDPGESVRITNQGLEHLNPDFRDAYFLWIYKAINELLFLDDFAAAKKSYGEGAKWAFLQNDDYSNAVGKRALETKEFLEGDPDSAKAKESAWTMLLYNANDEKSFLRVVANIRSLGGKVWEENGRLRVKFE